MRIWHISDTHSYHDLLEIPKNIDVVIHSGDASNARNEYINENEFRKFLTWFDSINIKHKIYVAGNHDTSIEKGLITKDNFNNIHYLENEHIIIDGFKFFGSPHCPNFGNWAFMKARHKIFKVWENIDLDTDVVITHTPPKTVLDLSYDRLHKLEFCGCGALYKKIVNHIKPKLHLFGHIHNCEGIVNSGTKKLGDLEIIFSNGSVVTDGKFGKLSSNGNIFEL